VTVHVFDRTAAVNDEPALVIRRFRDTPLRWLPLAAGLHGTSAFDGRLRILGVPIAARFTIGGPWEGEAHTSRRVQMVVGGSAGGPKPLAQLDGELSVSVAEGNAEVHYRGSGITANRGPRRLLGRLVMTPIAGAMVRAVARRLGTSG
jgi:hypothetical protein